MSVYYILRVLVLTCLSMVRSHSNSSTNALPCHTCVDCFLRGRGADLLLVEVVLRVHGHFLVVVAKDLLEETR